MDAHVRAVPQTPRLGAQDDVEVTFRSRFKRPIDDLRRQSADIGGPHRNHDALNRAWALSAIERGAALAHEFRTQQRIIRSCKYSGVPRNPALVIRGAA